MEENVFFLIKFTGHLTITKPILAIICYHLTRTNSLIR